MNMRLFVAMTVFILAVTVVSEETKTTDEIKELEEKLKQMKEKQLEEQKNKEIEERVRAEMEAKLRAEIEEKIKKENEAKAAESNQTEEEAKRKADEEAKRKADEEAKRKAEEEAKKKADEEAKRKADEEAKKRADEARKKALEEEARKNAEDEAKRRAEEEAKLKAEEEARKKAEEAKNREKASKKEEEEKIKQAADEHLETIKTREVNYEYNETATHEDFDNKDTEYINQEKHETEMTEEEKIRIEWEEQVENFFPTDLLTVKLGKHERFWFYENVEKPNSMLKLAFYVNDEESKIDLEVRAPSGKRLFFVRDRIHLYHELHCEEAGTYEIILKNFRGEKKKVTLATHQDIEDKEPIKLEHLQQLHRKLKSSEQKLGSIKIIEQMITKRLEGHFDNSQKTNKNILWFSLLETVLMVSIFTVQLFYIRSLLNKM